MWEYVPVSKLFAYKKSKNQNKNKNLDFFFDFFFAGRISVSSPLVLVGFCECWSGPTSTDQLSDNPDLIIHSKYQILIGVL